MEINRVKVPIIYGPKEKYITRLFSDPDLQRETQITLPRMSFSIISRNYDATRKQNSLLKTVKGNTTTATSSQFMGVPYDINFELQIYSRHIDDGNQIVEQILPYFNPDYTVSAATVTELGFLKDIPIILSSISDSIEYEGNFDSVRYVIHTLNFTMKAYYYGPISTPKIIRKAIANIYNDPALKAGHIVRVNLNQGNNGTFGEDDIVFQGTDYKTANAFGTVLSWNPGVGALTIGDAHGTFKLDNVIKAVSSNASYTISSFDVSPMKLAVITVEPDPITAQPDDDYGYTTDIKEWPETL